MKKTKMALTKDIVKQIFPGTNPRIAEGEDGSVIYDFGAIYPKHLGIFIPSEVDRSNFSSVFPRTFESYFKDIDDETAYLSRLLEVKIEPILKGLGTECIAGQVVRGSDSEYTVFRFDELIDARGKMDLLCRVETEKLRIDDKIGILNTNPCFKEEVSELLGREMTYWIMPISSLFRIDDQIIAAIFAYAQALRRN